jgi:hypothetical protein
MKTFIALLLLVSSTGLGELSKNEIKSLSELIAIRSIGVFTERRDGTSNFFTSILIPCQWPKAGEDGVYDYSLKVWIKVVVEVTDRDKNTYLVEETARTGEGGFFMLTIPHGRHKKLEVTAYAVQHGIKKDDTFVPYEEKLFNTKSLKELTNRTTNYFPDEAGVHYRDYSDQEIHQRLMDSDEESRRAIQSQFEIMPPSFD